MQEKRIKIIIYGGNGFVGTHIAERLSQENNCCVVCLSRSGFKPIHLKNAPWSESVRWCKGDANSPDLKLLSEADIVIISIGSAPLPTFSKSAFKQQHHNNGVAPSNAIKGAAEAGVTRIILMGAQIPFFLNTNYYAYTKGKNMALQSAQDFAAISSEHSATVLQPGAIYGKRYLRNGKVVNLDTIMLPGLKIMPSQFTSVTKIADRIAKIVINNDESNGALSLLRGKNI